MIMLTEKQTQLSLIFHARIIVVIYLTQEEIHLSFGFGEFTGYDVPGGESRGGMPSNRLKS